MAETFILKILTPFGVVLETKASFLYFRSIDGDMGVNPRQLPFVTIAEIAPLYYLDEQGNKHIFASGGGLVSVDQETIKLFLRTCEAKDSIDIQRAKDKVKEVKELLASNKIDNDTATLSLAKALNRIATAELE